MATPLAYHGLEVGDWATWAGAIMSALAVIVALAIALMGGVRRLRDARANARFSAAILYTEATDLVGALHDLRAASSTALNLKSLSFGQVELTNIQHASSHLIAVGSTFSREHPRLLPGKVATDLAMTIGSISLLGEKVKGITDQAAKVQSIPTAFAVHVVENCDIAMTNMRSYFRFCEKIFDAKAHKKLLS